MSESRLHAARLRRTDSITHSDHDPILEDLKSFAAELGVLGAAGMSKEELVESLRQLYVLDTLLNRTDGIPKTRPGGPVRH